MSEIINSFISCFIFLISVYIFGIIVIEEKKKINLLNKIILFLVICTIHTFIFINIDGIIKPILTCIVCAALLKSFFKTTAIKVLFLSIIFAILNMISDLILLGIITNVLNIGKEYIYTELAGGILINLCISIIMISITWLLKNILITINYKISTNIKIIIVSSLTLISIAIFFFKFINKFRLDNGILGYIIAILALVVTLFYLFKQKMDNDIIMKKYDDLLNVMKNYETDIEEQRIMIHETRNELMTIKCKISDKEKESSIIKYIDSILGDKISSNMSKYSKFKYLPSNGIKGFFYYKFMEAEKRNIKVSVNISKKIEDSFLGNIDTKEFKDLVRIIGVYLDNAIEASSESKDKKLGIEIYLIGKDIEIIISNTFENEIKAEKIGIEKFTTKGKNHGYGLLLVKCILRSNSIFESTNEITNNVYIQKLIIKNNK